MGLRLRNRAAIFAAAFTVARIASAQIPALGPFDPDRGLPRGLQINDVSLYLGGFDYKVPVNGNGVLNTAPLTMLVGGSSADIGWYLPGERNQIFAIYSGGYNANAQYPALNGFDQMATLSFRSKLAPRVILTIDGLAQSTTYSGFLFQGSAAGAETPGAAGADPLSGAVDGQLPVGQSSSPLTLVLYGARYRGGSAGASLTFLKSPRFEWTLTARETRALPSTGQTNVFNTNLQFAGVTNVEGLAGFSYSVSPRTTVSVDANYLQSESRYYPLRTMMAIAGVKRILSRQLYVHAEGGSGTIGQLSGMTQTRPAYHALGAIRGTKGFQTISLEARRDNLDLLGLGASITSAVNLVWSWNRPSSDWILGTNAGYQRMQGDGVQLIQGWLAGANVSRRLSRQTKVVFQAAYTANSGRAQAGLESLTGTSLRLSFVWSPLLMGRPQNP